MKNESKIILIIGNGFDLNAGLKSSYQNFYEYRKTTYDIYEKIHTEIKKSTERLSSLSPKIKVISLDVIKQELEDANMSSINYWEFLFTYIATSGKRNFNWFQIEEIINEHITKHDPYKISWDFRDYTTIHYEELGKKVDNRFKLSELKRFEKIFSDYISEITNSDYNKEAYSLFNKLINGKKGAFILNFNYTNPVFRENDIVVNIHGSIEKPNSIIFGIDNNNTGNGSDSAIFTKTLRNVVNKKSIEKLPDKKELEAIYFYGHSLSDADYSYFQSLFDYYDIYNSDVKLIFKYSNYGGKEREQENAENVYKLIRTYGEKTYQKNIGTNLIHKLLLEGRLLLELID